MTTSNRFANRLVVAIVGAVLLAAGVLGILLATLPGFAPQVDVAVGSGVSALSSRLSPPAGSDMAATWPLYVIAAIALVALVVAIVFASRHGRGRTGTVLVDDATSDAAGPDAPGGRVELSTGFAASLIESALTGRSDVLSVNVSAYRHRKQTALKVRVLPRAGVSPRTIVEVTRGVVTALDELVGHRQPVLLEIASSTRAQLTSTERVH